MICRHITLNDKFSIQCTDMGCFSEGAFFKSLNHTKIANAEVWTDFHVKLCMKAMGRFKRPREATNSIRNKWELFYTAPNYITI